MKTPLKIGLTGGIGSGKSTVAHLFEKIGIPVYVADTRAKTLINSDKQLQAAIEKQLGEAVFENGILNRQKMGRLIFNDPLKKQNVEAIIHPAVAQDFDNWAAKQSSLYILKEAAILFETNGQKKLEAVVVVTAPEWIRIQRVLQRDIHLTKEDVEARMAQQWPEEQKIALADYQIKNEGNQFLMPQILACHENIIRRANAKS